jgi:chaperonin cofactor prefoldin
MSENKMIMNMSDVEIVGRISESDTVRVTRIENKINLIEEKIKFLESELRDKCGEERVAIIEYNVVTILEIIENMENTLSLIPELQNRIENLMSNKNKMEMRSEG